MELNAFCLRIVDANIIPVELGILIYLAALIVESGVLAMDQVFCADALLL